MDEKKQSKTVFSASGLVIGTVFAIALGFSMDNWGVGIAIGVALALAFSSAATKRKRTDPNDI